ncbi:ABC transporter substrate-binding protein [Paenibacillus sp. BC26]|uniref:ABC transporter substrate-binding protein n=1 Tax=Paenibacillus sp. BC26 TaxID=1881032 RepID=UPI0008F21C45|nr:ABC transporter substrate-binding protein [Paenibacillus sp. BC26]SFT24030.1 carbohydrate ABC transporter substrate-binding protein, CUT1 family [Paenibacillus sp. BC26]
MKKTAFLKLLLASMLIVLLVSACGGNNKNNETNTSTNEPATTTNTESTTSKTETANEPAEPEKEELPPVELTYYIPQPELQPDLASVEAAINEYIKPKINATVKLLPITFGDYDQKMNTIVSAGETFDMMWTSNWSFNYENNSLKGAFKDLESLVTTYAPDFINSLPKAAIEGARNSQGKLYAIPNYQIIAQGGGFVIQKEMVDKYGLDISTIKTYKDLEPFLEKVKAGEPDKIAFGSRSNSFVPYMHGFDGLAGVEYRTGDPNYKLEYVLEAPEYLAFHQLLHDWFKKGYVNKDVATATFADYQKAGKIVSFYEWTLKPGGEIEMKQNLGGKDVVFIPLYEPRFSGVQPTMTAISNTSKNPERAMMFLNLANTDPALFNLLAFGVEGKHYDKLDATHIKVKTDGGYAPNVAWAMGNVTIGYLLEGQSDDTWPKTIELNNSAMVPEIWGFQFNQEPVKTELANMDAVYKEYEAAVTTGAVDPNEYMPKLVDAMKKAGSAKVIEEKQKQLDEWLKAKGKK